MLTLCGDRAAFFDIDETLVTQENREQRSCDLLVTHPSGEKIALWVLAKGVNKLKEKSAAGYCIVAWSQQGAAWTEVVIRALKLESIVHLAMVKPEVVYDDLPFSEWTKRVDPNKLK